MLIERPEFEFAGKLDSNPGLCEADIYSSLFREASDFGGFTVEIVKHIWLNHLFLAESEIKSLFRYGYRLSYQRLEAASTRAVFYGHISSNMVKTILIEKLDQLVLDHSIDVYGQKRLF